MLFLLTLNLVFSQAKGIWVTRFSLLDQNESDELLHFLKENQISDLFLQVRGRADAYYKSKFEKNHKGKHSEERLRKILDFCKKNKIRTHAWINVFLLASSQRHIEKEANHILQKKSNWIDHFEEYAPFQIKLHDSEDLKREKKLEGIYTVPCFPDLEVYYKDIIRELIQDYNFDGIHFDYFRLAGKNAGFHPKMRRLFKEKTGLYIEASSKEQNLKNEWFQFLSEQYSSFLSSLTQIDPKRIWSVAVKANPYQAKYEFAQDWKTWLKKGIVNFVVTMNYTRSEGLFEKNLEYYVPYPKKIWVGLASYNKSYDSLKRGIKKMQQMKKNYVVFSFNDLYQKKIKWLPNN